MNKWKKCKAYLSRSNSARLQLVIELIFYESPSKVHFVHFIFFIWFLNLLLKLNQWFLHIFFHFIFFLLNISSYFDYLHCFFRVCHYSRILNCGAQCESKALCELMIKSYWMNENEEGNWKKHNRNNGTYQVYHRVN